MTLLAPQALEALARAMRADQPVPHETRDVLRTGVEAYLAGQESRLDRALGLVTHGGLSPARERALEGRNFVLRRLWRNSPEWRDLAAPAAACFMASSASRYETDRFPRERDAYSAPSAEPAATWWRILRSDVPIPKAKQLQKILEAEFQDGFEIPGE